MRITVPGKNVQVFAHRRHSQSHLPNPPTATWRHAKRKRKDAVTKPAHRHNTLCMFGRPGLKNAPIMFDSVTADTLPAHPVD